MRTLRLFLTLLTIGLLGFTADSVFAQQSYPE